MNKKILNKIDEIQAYMKSPSIINRFVEIKIEEIKQLLQQEKENKAEMLDTLIAVRQGFELDYVADTIKKVTGKNWDKLDLQPEEQEDCPDCDGYISDCETCKGAGKVNKQEEKNLDKI